MQPMMPIMFIVWGAVVLCFLGLLAYRATVTRYEDDQLFLSEESGQHQHVEQDALIAKVNKLRPMVRLFGSAAGLLTAAIVGVYVWGAMKTMLQ
jgi:hypothetical protein